MSSRARHRATGQEDAAAPAGDAEAPLDDQEQTAKDRSYSPGSERETELRQQESSTDEALRPGTGGPDDSGDLPAPDDLDVSTVVERSESGHRPGDG